MLDFGFDFGDARGRDRRLVAMAAAAEAGITPSSARTVLAAASTWSQQRYLFSSVQMAPIAGRV